MTASFHRIQESAAEMGRRLSSGQMGEWIIRGIRRARKGGGKFARFLEDGMSEALEFCVQEA